MSITEERRARHLELRERMLAGDNGARWELAMEAVHPLLSGYMKRHRSTITGSIEYGDMEQEALILCHHMVPQWDPDRSSLSTYAYFFHQKLDIRLIRASGPVSRLGNDYQIKAKLRVVRESTDPCDSPSGAGERFEQLVGAAIGGSNQSHEDTLDAKKLFSSSGLTSAEKVVLSMRMDDESLQACGDEIGKSREWARILEASAHRKLRESAGVRCG